MTSMTDAIFVIVDHVNEMKVKSINSDLFRNWTGHMRNV